MFRVPEVQIERPFIDPQDRIETMLEFERMRRWSWRDPAYPTYGITDNARLVYCNVKNGVMVWKFAFDGCASAKAFDAVFDPFTVNTAAIVSGETVTVTG